ncbi:MAG TPA: enoyl-CoA hydratase-related protein [Allosphingosinicella sp.]|jgi:enoyl-CoA hydratase/carnithine racemase|uniref:enoyl-CoA hydratase/isomerase family protein n=1 Tax=Allosphingosinicella sp. TaxID=2823234 RepID=UPI002F277769
MFELTLRGGEIAILRLDRPEVRNAIPLAGWAELEERVEEATAAGARALILAGVPDGAFCAGADVADFGLFAIDEGARARFRLAIRSGLDRLRDAPIPTLAMIEGAAYGAGLALAMACDIRLAGAGAQLAATPAKLGISYPQEDVHRLVSLVGGGQAARLLLSAGSIDGREAERIGLVERFFESDLEGEALILASQMAANDPDSLRVLKRGIRLAAAGVEHDAEQDRSFDALLGSDALTRRLGALRKPGR